jgi:hypothetical protein
MDPQDLIGTESPAPLQAAMLAASQESWAYFLNDPYPRYAFGPRQWPPEKGPIPTPLPYAGIVIAEGAEFVFRNGSPAFSVPPEQRAGLEDADAYLQTVIRANRLSEAWTSLAENCANQGAIAAKFSYDGDSAERPVRIAFLDVPQECRVWFDPHDCERPLLARIQYPYRNPADGNWYYFREEWTEALHVTYRPKPAGSKDCTCAEALPGYLTSLGDGDGPEWEVAAIEENPFGLVPVTVIRNRRMKGNPLGTGDCWSTFRLIDRIARTLHGEDASNQLHSDPTVAVLNAEIDNDAPLGTGEMLSIRNENPDAPPADVRLLEPSGAAREFSHKSMDRWEDLFYKRVGLSRVNPAEVTNKGNMTALAFAMTYARTIASSDRKRELWGNSGMAVFFRNLLLSLSRVGGIRELAGVDEQLVISTEWPPYFQVTDEDRANLTDRTTTQVNAGFLTPDRGAERIARAEGVPQHEIKNLLTELGQQREQRKSEAAAAPAVVQDPEAEATAG